MIVLLEIIGLMFWIQVCAIALGLGAIVLGVLHARRRRYFMLANSCMILLANIAIFFFAREVAQKIFGWIAEFSVAT